MVLIYQSKEYSEKIPGKTTRSFSQTSPEKKEAKKIDSIFTDYTESFLSVFEESFGYSSYYLEAKIKVSEVLGKFARAYERLRTTIEYKGEHLLRRNAIERILKRLSWQKDNLRPNIDSKLIAKTLIKELIWASYLPNDFLPIYKEDEVEKALDKYFYLLSNFDNLPAGVSMREIKNWIWEVASSEIEDILDPSNRDLYVKLMYDWFNHHYYWKDQDLNEEEKKTQILIAIHRSFTKSDNSIIRYHLLLREFPNWKNASMEDINKFITNFPQIYDQVESALRFPGRLALYRKIQKQTAAFEIIRTICNQEKKKVRNLFADKKNLNNKIRKVCQEKYNQIKKRVNTGIIRSIIYIFITKVIFALFLEVPYEVLRLNEIRYIPLSLNIIFPPFLMFLIGLSIKIPGAKNTEKLVELVDSIVYPKKDFVRYEFSIKKSGGRSTLLLLFSFFYFLLFVFVFGGMYYLLNLLNFSFLGIIVFFMFLSLVLLFVFRVKYQASQLRVESEDEGFLSSLLNFIALPLINLGHYISSGLSKFNFLTIFLDIIIEAPLKSVIEILEEWLKFLKEKREEVIEIPE